MTNPLTKLPTYIQEEIWDSVRRGVENGAIRTRRESFQATFALIAAGWIIYRDRGQESNHASIDKPAEETPARSDQTHNLEVCKAELLASQRQVMHLLKTYFREHESLNLS